MPGTLSLNAISVDLEVLTADKLRKVIFGLDKSKTDESNDRWELRFQLFERETKSDPFTEALVSLKVIAKVEHHPHAEETARKGLTRAQSEHLLGPASIDAKRFLAGKITEDKANASVEKTLPKRDA